MEKDWRELRPFNAGKTADDFFTRRGSAGKRYSLVYEMKMFFFFFISYNEWEGRDTGTSAYSGTTLSEVGEFYFFY